MAEIVNLNRVRKERARETARALAAENRTRHGRTLAERRREHAERQAAERGLDASRLESGSEDPGDVSGGANRPSEE